MNLMKPLAVALLAALSLNVAMAANWCGYDTTATINTGNVKATEVPAMVTALNNAAKKCGYSAVAGHSSKVAQQLSDWATECTNAAGNVAKALTSLSMCGEHYNNLKVANPAFLNSYKYPADYQSYEVSHGPFCDNGTNPANPTNYTGNSLCQCIDAFGYANQSNDGTLHPVNMIGHAPYSWLSESDINTYKSRVKHQLTYVLGLGSNPNNYSIYTGNSTAQTPAQCCTVVGGTVNGTTCN